ncbi:hypothetical protein PsAD46_02529 [Pseudovibrio sp. Ad46]|nr:hypothetical protein PsAD46_02529 [Pseudovibrio sp. Ad46]KZK91208.1 hypothetical protein PsAD5_04346 [Pseudovibrio sp. Ad5]
MSEDLEAQIDLFVDYYNSHLYHMSLGSVTLADAFCRRNWQLIKPQALQTTTSATMHKPRSFHTQRGQAFHYLKANLVQFLLMTDRCLTSRKFCYLQTQ